MKKTHLIYIVVAAVAVGLLLLLRQCGSESGSMQPAVGSSSGSGSMQSPPAIASEAKQSSVHASEAEPVIPTGAREESLDSARDRLRGVEESAPTIQAEESGQRGIAADSSTALRSARNDKAEPPTATANSQLPKEGEQSPAVIASEALPAATADSLLPAATADSQLPTATADCQLNTAGYEFGLYGTLGLSQLLADMPAGSMQPHGIAPGFGADFTYFFAQHWGVGIGVEAAFFRVRLFNADIGAAQPGNPATLYVLKHTGALSATYLRLPLWLRFRTPLRRHQFYAALGGSFDLPLAGRLRTETVRRTGSSPATQTETTTGTLRFGFSAGLLAETGLRWTLGEHWGLYTGVYAGYGLSNVAPSLQGVDKINLLSAGAKAKLIYDF